MNPIFNMLVGFVQILALAVVLYWLTDYARLCLRRWYIKRLVERFYDPEHFHEQKKLTWELDFLLIQHLQWIGENITVDRIDSKIVGVKIKNEQSN